MITGKLNKDIVGIRFIWPSNDELPQSLHKEISQLIKILMGLKGSSVVDVREIFCLSGSGQIIIRRNLSGFP